MAYTITNVYALGPAYTGVSLRAQLYDSTNVAVGSAISSGFYERAGGKGIFAHALSVPDSHVGWCDIYVDGASSTILATIAINPQELENADVKTSTRGTSTLTTTDIDNRLAAYDPPTKAELDTAQAAIIAAISGVAAAVWTYSTRTLTSFGSLIAEIWSYGTRTITMTAVQLASSVAGSAIELVAGATAEITFSGTVPVTWQECYWTVKQSGGQIDSQSVIQIRATNGGDAGDGLIFLNEVPATAAQGGIVVNVGSNTVVITLHDDATALLSNTAGMLYDVKFLKSDGKSTVYAYGLCNVRYTATKTV